MNVCQTYAKGILHVMAGTTQGKFWRAFTEQAVEFSKVDWDRSLDIAENGSCTINQCFHNASLVGLQIPELQYYEGYACYIFPVEHAWLVDPKTNTVIDPTWCLINGDDLPPPSDYFGVAIPANYAARHYNSRHMWVPAWSRYLFTKEQERRMKKHDNHR